MTVPAPLIEFFQHEAAEYLERLDQLISSAGNSPPDGATFVAQARALRGSAMMTRLDGLSELCATVERVANGVRSGELRWDQRLLFAVHGALVEIKALVELSSKWGEAEQRRSRTQSVALAAVAAGYLAGGPLPSMSPASAVIPVSRLLVDDGEPAIVYRNPSPAITIAQRFRGDIAAAADGVAREAASLSSTRPGGAQLAVGDGVRRALLGLADIADSYGAASISVLSTRMARASLDQIDTRTAVQAFARLLMDRDCTDQELAAHVRSAAAAWNRLHGTPSGSNATTAAQTPTAKQQAIYTPAKLQAVTAQNEIVAVEDLLYSGSEALKEAIRVRDKLNNLLMRDGAVSVEVRELVHELSDLLELAVKSGEQ